MWVVCLVEFVGLCLIRARGLTSVFFFRVLLYKMKSKQVQHQYRGVGALVSIAYLFHAVPKYSTTGPSSRI